MAEPIDVQSMRVVLEGMGVKEYDDKVVFQLYEFVYRMYYRGLGVYQWIRVYL